VLLDHRRTEAVKGFLASVDERASEILRLRFGLDGREPMTLKEIGGKVGLTRERVRQIERHTLKCINNAIQSQESDARVAVSQ